MLDRLKPLWISIVGDPGEIGSERYFVSVACLVPSIFLFILCILHLLMKLKPAPVLYAGGSAVTILGLFFLVRSGSCLFYPKLILSILGLVMLDFTWYSKFLSDGPVLMYVLIFGALLLWVWDGKWLVFLLGLYFLNIAVLFSVEKSAPAPLLSYNDPDTRINDIYLSLAIYSSLMISLLYVVKRELNRRTEQARQSDQLKSAFLSNMSHEIRSPLNAIVGFSQLLNKNLARETRKQFVNTIQQSSDQLLNLIDNILVLSKIEAKQFEINHKIFSLKELFIELQGTFSIIALKKGKKDVQIKYELTGGDIILNTDPFRLKQVLSNLIDNAIKFTTSGTITFACRADGNKLLFSVADQGIGIPEKDHNIIFDRFSRFDYQGMNPDGTGIGLSIARQIVNALNGQIWVTSTVGKGSVFYFSLPSEIISKLPKTRKHTSITSKPLEKAKSKPILIVEDDQFSTLIIKEVLKDTNIEIYHVKDGFGAIEFVRANPDLGLILMDLKLPGLNGYEATRIIKQMQPGIPIIAQTAYALEGDREKALNAGCNDYISKPYNIQHFKYLVLKYI